MCTPPILYLSQTKDEVETNSRLCPSVPLFGWKIQIGKFGVIDWKLAVACLECRELRQGKVVESVIAT